MEKLRRFATILLLPALAAGAYALNLTPRYQSGEVTLLLQFEDAPSELSVESMKQEFASLLRDSGVRFAWKRLNTEVSQELANPVVIRFKGACRMAGTPPVRHQPGAFAWAHVTNGDVLPFVDVSCDRLRGSLFSVMWGEDFQHRDFLLGRAMARVLAHEMHHVLGATQQHDKEGVAKERLSGRELIADDFAGFGAH